MLISSEIRNSYEKIQKQLFYMIPEKWDRVYLYASVLDHYNNVQTGEMFFYYYPKSVIKRNPINVYEVPNKFNLDEKAYLKLAEQLYEEIKKIRTTLIKDGENPWSNLTISIENFKFKVEYNYDDLMNSKYTSYDRHLIWRYKYLDVPLNSFSRKDRKMVEEYLRKEQYYNKNINTYIEGIYKKTVSDITQYSSSVRTTENDSVQLPEQRKTNNKELNKKTNIEAQEVKIKSQILKSE